MDKMKVVYISSLGHSGSTLLDVLLNQHSAIQSVGEVMFYDNWVNQGLLCSCTKPLLKCPFWAAVTPEDNFMLGEIFSPGYVDNSYLLFQGIQQFSQASIIVDSSKSPQRLQYLLSDPRFEVKVIHLVRNGLAVVNSLNKSHDRPGTEHKLKTKSTPLLTGIFRWIRRNKSIEKLAHNIRPDQYLRIRYEDLCTQPELELGTICKFIGVDFEKGMLKPTLQNNHNIGGSRWRFSNKAIEIRLDDKWKNELEWHSKTLFNLLGSRLNKKYGYSVETS